MSLWKLALFLTETKYVDSSNGLFSLHFQTYWSNGYDLINFTIVGRRISLLPFHSKLIIKNAYNKRQRR